MRPTRPQPTKADQHGAVLLLMLIIVVLGVVAALVGSLSTTALKNARQEKTAAALAQAKEALIGRAVADATHPGSLPCPDTDDKGSAQSTVGQPNNNCPSYIGRLPWRTLGLPDLRDGDGERLWYVLSSELRDQKFAHINSDTAGSLTVTGTTAASNVIAIVFAPGNVLSSQNQSRSATQTAACATTDSTVAASLCATNYLEGSNANLNTPSNLNLNYQTAATGDTFNDQTIFITRDQLFPVVEMRIAREVKKCLDEYANISGGKYPLPTPVLPSSTASVQLFYSLPPLFGRLPAQPLPNSSIKKSPLNPAKSLISTMQSKFEEFWTALATFAASKTWSNRTAMRSKASAAEDAADDVGDFYDTSPSNPLENAADDLEDAADDAYDDLTTSSSDAAIAAIQQRIVNAANDFVNTLPQMLATDLGMSPVWTSSCITLLSSGYWNDWKDLVFFQVADGFKPGSSASCGNCLSVEGSAHSLAGSGSYRATVAIAGKKLTASRTTSIPGDYLEADNLLPRNDSTKPYQTYRITDAAYQTVNDLVLCLDGKVNCQ